MASRLLQRLARVATAAAAVALVAATVAEARPARPLRPSQRARGFSLFAGSVNVEHNANRIQCNINNIGNVCVDPTGTGTLPGAAWPKGTPNQYIFNSGLQIAATIPGVDTPTFPWPGDTVGVYFFDASGFYKSTAPINDVYNGLSTDDLDSWPNQAYVRDTSLFSTDVVGLKTISQQDSWTRYWDGDPVNTNGRVHPLGILVEQRGLAWNFPVGNEDIIYFLYRFTNVTTTDPARYQGLKAYGYTDADISEFVQIATSFHTLNEAAYGIAIPDSGFWFTNTYAAFGMDPDVSQDARQNYSTAILNFAIGFAYHRAFTAAEFVYPGSINSGAFARAPGFVGVKYLKSPQDIGIANFYNTINGGSFADPGSGSQMWRYLSANLTASDGVCSVPDYLTRNFCYIEQTAQDTRFYQSSGPFTMKPGESAVIVVAYIMAAPVASLPARTPGVGLNIPAFTLPIGTTVDVKPNFPLDGRRIPTSQDSVKTIDRATGWDTHSADLDANGQIDQYEVTTVPRSLLNKSLVAQAVFDSKFLLPFAPSAPAFTLIPGDGSVTVVWEKSPSEDPVTGGDPYFAVASNPASPLYDRNFRRFDVEGYRVWKGRTQSSLVVVAQFDYAGTAMLDYTGNFHNDAYGTRCAPDIGLLTSCPAFPYSYSLSGDVVQIPVGGKTLTAAGDALITSADTAVTGGGSGYAPLVDNGVPFAYVDTTVENGFTYFYAVTAFDVNSVRSGPTSLESPAVPDEVIPRANSSNPVSPLGAFTVFITGEDGVALDPNGTGPTINATTGIFSGPALPTDGLNLVDFNVFLPSLIAENSTSYITIDSIVPQWYHLARYYFTGTGGIQLTSVTGYVGPLGEEDGSITQAGLGTTTASSSPDVPFTGNVEGSVTQYPVVWTSLGADWHYQLQGSFWAEPASGMTSDGGSRWFEGANETMAEPTLGTSSYGQLTGVTTIYQPKRSPTGAVQPGFASQLFRRFQQTTYHVFRAADMKIYWSSTPGVPDSVVDVTHHVRVRYDPQNRASYGFLQDFTANSTGSAPNGVMNYNDFLYGPCLDLASGVSQTGCNNRDYATGAVLGPVDVTGDLVADGNGFGLYINGEPFIFLAAALPAAPAVWTYRSYVGDVNKSTGSYTFTPYPRNPAVPGLRLAIRTSTAAALDTTTAGNLANVHTVPDPYYVTTAWENTQNNKQLRFVNLPYQAIVRIYSASGILVAIVNHNDPSGGGEAVWNLRNRNNQFVASGVYFYHVEAADGQTKIGRFTVVNFAQ